MYDSRVQLVGMRLNRSDKIWSEDGGGTYAGSDATKTTESSDIPAPYVETQRKNDLSVDLWILVASTRPARIE